MTLEQEMRQEVARLQRELMSIDLELEKMNSRIVQLLDTRKKMEYDLRVLRGSVEENYIKDIEEESLAKFIGKKIKV
ncbi:MAG TPA: hypothetical protein HA230_01260 [Candidatus Aenigmarchaeota archaeon]|nr:hypothetical protein [Candidatus Aenigmarchaeota archaeon]